MVNSGERTKAGRLEVCSSCKWFELIKEAVGNCRNPSITRRMVPSGDTACLAFESKENEKEEKEKKEKKENDYRE